MRMFVVFFGLPFFLTSCASIHSGNIAVQSDNNAAKSKLGIVVSGKEDTSLASKYFGIVNFTFENTTQKWVRVKKISVDFGDQALSNAVKVPLGHELQAWLEAAQENRAIRQYNTDLVLGTIAAGATVTAAASRSRELTAIAGATAAGSLMTLSVDHINRQRDALQVAKMVPDSHLYSSVFVIPPGMHTKKWIVFQTETPETIPLIKELFITYETDRGQTERLKLTLRTLGQISDWQGDHPDVKAYKQAKKL